MKKPLFWTKQKRIKAARELAMQTGEVVRGYHISMSLIITAPAEKTFFSRYPPRFTVYPDGKVIWARE